MNSQQDHELNQSLADAYQQVQERWTDRFTGDSDAKRARRGEGGGQDDITKGFNPFNKPTRDSAYNPATGTTRMKDKSQRVFARKGGKAGYMTKGDPSSWRPTNASSTAAQQGARRHDQIRNSPEVKATRERETADRTAKRASEVVNKDGNSVRYTRQSDGSTRRDGQQATLGGKNVRWKVDKSGKGQWMGADGKPAKTPSKPSESSNKPETPRATTPTPRPTTSTSSSTSRSSTPSRTAQTGNKTKDMQTWAKANPKLAAKVKPGQSGYKAIQSMNKPTAGQKFASGQTGKPITRSAPKQAAPKADTSQVRAMSKPSTPASTPKPVSGIKSSRLASALGGVKKYTPKAESVEWINEMYYGEGFKPFPKAKVQDKAAMKPDTPKGEMQARRMDRARKAHTDKDTKDIAKGAVKEREMSNKKKGLEKRYNAPSADNAAEKDRKNKAYKLEAGRRKDLDKRYAPKKESVEIQEGEKDACYHKVKSRYKVWPSAYGSGALVKCRQKGAKNWGNSSKKEEVQYMDENRRAARAAGGYKDDGKKQPDPSKPGFTGIGNMSIKDIMKMNRDIQKRTKKEEVEYVDEMSREKFDTMSGKPSSAIDRGGETATIQKKVDTARTAANASGARGTEFVKPAKLQQTVNKAATMRNSYEPEGEMIPEGLTGERQKRARDMKGTPYMKGGGKRTSRDNVTLHNLADRNDGPGTPSYEKKSTGGKGGRKYAGYGDQGAGNKARRRMGQEPIRGTRKEGWEMDAYVSALDFMSNRWQ